MNTMILRQLSYGLYIVSTLDGDSPTGCTANSVMQITSSPATLAISINHDNYTNQCIKESQKFAVSILSESSDPGIIGTFGFQSGKETKKFAQVDYQMKNDLPVIADSCGYMICKVIDQLETSSHTIFIGEILDGDVFSENPPMTYSYYHNVIKGKSPKAAPTYIPEAEEAKPENDQVKYKCSVCGYVYEGETPFEELGDDFVCPVCKMPKSVFEKI